MNQNLARNLKFLRQKNHMSLRDLENVVKINKTKLWKIENNALTGITYEDVCMLARYFDVSPNYLFYENVANKINLHSYKIRCNKEKKKNNYFKVTLVENEDSERLAEIMALLNIEFKQICNMTQNSITLKPLA